LGAELACGEVFSRRKASVERTHTGQSTEMTENSNGREEDGDKRRYRE